MHRHRAIDWLHIRLLHKDLLDLRVHTPCQTRKMIADFMLLLPSMASGNVHYMNVIFTLYWRQHGNCLRIRKGTSARPLPDIRIASAFLSRHPSLRPSMVLLLRSELQLLLYKPWC